MIEARPVIVTTEYRGVFFGVIHPDDAQPDNGDVILRDAKCAIKFGTTKGWMQLAATGPTDRSKIGSPAPKLTIRKVTAIADVTDEAATAWETA